jgi:hypothetical protein
LGVETVVQKLNINQTVWKILASDLAVQKDFSRKIVNVRALAKHILKKYELPASLDSVISAIRRFQGSENFEDDERGLLHIFKDSVVSTKNNMACITLAISPQQLFSKLCMDGHYSNHRSIPIKVTTGSDETKMVVEQPHLDKVKGWFDKSDVIDIDKDLSELHIVVAEKAILTKGVMARIANELSLANINIHEVIICPPEFLLYVKERDIVKAHEAILKMCEGKD